MCIATSRYLVTGTITLKMISEMGAIPGKIYNVWAYSVKHLAEGLKRLNRSRPEKSSELLWRIWHLAIVFFWLRTVACHILHRSDMVWMSCPTSHQLCLIFPYSHSLGCFILCCPPSVLSSSSLTGESVAGCYWCLEDTTLTGIISHPALLCDFKVSKVVRNVKLAI